MVCWDLNARPADGHAVRGVTPGSDAGRSRDRPLTPAEEMEPPPRFWRRRPRRSRQAHHRRRPHAELDAELGPGCQHRPAGQPHVRWRDVLGGFGAEAGLGIVRWSCAAVRPGIGELAALGDDLVGRLAVQHALAAGVVGGVEAAQQLLVREGAAAIGAPWQRRLIRPYCKLAGTASIAAAWPELKA